MAQAGRQMYRGGVTWALISAKVTTLEARALTSSIHPLYSPTTLEALSPPLLILSIFLCLFRMARESKRYINVPSSQ